MPSLPRIWRTVAAAGVAGAAGYSLYKWLQPFAAPSVEKPDATLPDDAQIKKDFESAFPRLVSQFLEHARTAHELPPNALQRLEKMFNYNCMGGKMNRGLITVTASRDLCKASGLSFARRSRQAIVLGWCIEILQACFLVADDIMDHSSTRRGQPCWYKLPEVQLDAINDTLILESFIYFLLKQSFGGTTMYVPLVELYREVSFQTQMGQMLDLMSQPHGQRGSDILYKFTPALYQQIVRYKTAFYSFYLPFAGAMILCGFSSPDKLKVAREISLLIGEKFQIQDDILDCFGEPAVIGKIGTDIQDHKCSWLVVQALLRANAEQRKLLETHYGRSEAESVDKVKQLYNALNLRELHDQVDEQLRDAILQLIQRNSTVVPSVIFERTLAAIHKRSK